MSTTPMGDPQTMPLADLRTEAFAGDPPAPEPVVTSPSPVEPTAPVIPDPYSVQQGEEGLTVQMSPEFGGEVFKGKDWAEVGPKIAKAKADANAYIKTLKAQPAQPTQTTPPTPPADNAEDAAVQAWLLEQNAKALGLSKEQYVQRMTMVFDSGEKMSINATLADFHQLCPRYVDTTENNAVLTEYLGDLDHFPTARELKQAYAEAVLDGKITPAAAAQASATPHYPPPMPGAVASNQGGENAWQMDKDALKRAAFGQ